MSILIFIIIVFGGLFFIVNTIIKAFKGDMVAIMGLLFGIACLYYMSTL